MSETFDPDYPFELAIRLIDANPDVDPLALELGKLRHLIETLDRFDAGALRDLSDQTLETIRSAWHERYQKRIARGDHDIGEGG